ncbi:biopolymer transporter ExbD [Novosphingobium sp. PY1]|uniref:Biopolymer transport protein ExbD/TolR n=1 Tax=Ochrobactrum sp. PW1 TaxID=1882222 RepID=A0A292GS52_9HYPH|nr:biopolymer transporter ExbD [Novosphingobium sp. PY1]BBA74276.1 biopolymer transport protein ExbD/TolR [Ochrobactrum sp. PW1]GFM29125.1 biopolymer transport protein ExbD/TolR [Novosphingobium sp. PY1]
MAVKLSNAAGRSRRGIAARSPMAEVNVTPLVDVMLVLLIIFMVTAPLIKAGVPLDLPKTRANALGDEKDQVTLSIARDGRIYIDDGEVAPGELPERLADLSRKGRDEPPLVTLRADRRLDYGRIMEVMGEINRAGLQSISLVTLVGDSAAPREPFEVTP